MHLHKPSACRGGAAPPALDIWRRHPAWTLQRTTTDSVLETAAVDWALEPTFQKRAASCHNRPHSVAGPQHIARCCQNVATPSAIGWLSRCKGGHVRWGGIGGFFLFRSPKPPALTVSC